MSKQYIGHLPVHDPLHHYLQYDILPQIGLDHLSGKISGLSYGWEQ